MTYRNTDKKLNNYKLHSFNHIKYIYLRLFAKIIRKYILYISINIVIF